MEDAEIPLRVSSAVVSELSPIVLLLKYKKVIDRVFYEEPEMCLHPQLQKNIARLLCMIVKSGIPITATTHSDIIIQHINNMIRLNVLEQKQKDNICKRFGYSDKEIISCDDITVYQFTEEASGYTKVESIDCTEYGFEVRSFNDALDKILDEVYEIQQ